MKEADVEFIPIADEEGNISGVFSQVKAMEYLLGKETATCCTQILVSRDR